MQNINQVKQPTEIDRVNAHPDQWKITSIFRCMCDSIFVPIEGCMKPPRTLAVYLTNQLYIYIFIFALIKKVKREIDKQTHTKNT